MAPRKDVARPPGGTPAPSGAPAVKGGFKRPLPVSTGAKAPAKAAPPAATSEVASPPVAAPKPTLPAKSPRPTPPPKKVEAAPQATPASNDDDGDEDKDERDSFEGLDSEDADSNVHVEDPTNMMVLSPDADPDDMQTLGMLGMFLSEDKKSTLTPTMTRGSTFW